MSYSVYSIFEIQHRGLFDRCTIQRTPAPGTKLYPPLGPYPQRLRGGQDPSPAGIRDVYYSDSFRRRIRVAPGTLDTVNLGFAQKPGNQISIGTHIIDVDGNYLDWQAVINRLAGVVFFLMLDNVPIFSIQGCPGMPMPGEYYYVDLDGGEQLGVLIDNTDPNSTLLATDTVVVQMLLRADPVFRMEVDRKDTPNAPV